MELKKENWGEYNNEMADLFTVSDLKTGFFVQISNFGSTIVRVKTSDKNGTVDDISFGQNSPNDYVKYGGSLGSTIGRIANRIADSKYKLDGKEYTLFSNNGKHSLHGGKNGFNYKFWKCLKAETNKKEEILLTFEYVSEDGEEGYPGKLRTEITYKISPMRLEWVFKATTDKSTIVNLTNHAYWNLDGLNSLIDDLEIMVDADKYMPGDETLLPTGKIRKVENSGMDFRKLKKLSKIFNEVGDIDNNFILNNYREGIQDPKLATELLSPKTGRLMKIYTTEPGLQVYTGNFMGRIKSFDKQCRKHSGICLETQKFPNAINMPKYANSVILRPDQSYYHKTIHEFYIK